MKHKQNCLAVRRPSHPCEHYDLDAQERKQQCARCASGSRPRKPRTEKG